jgi:O-antigen ligase
MWVSFLLGIVIHLGVADFLPSARVFLDFTYWLLVFLCTAHFTSTSLNYNRIAGILATSVCVLPLVRLFEALALGSVGAWSGLILQSQNNYAILFTTFSPFLLIFLVSTRWRNRLFALLGLLLVWTAAVINGSRGCWLGMAIGTLVFTIMFTCSKPRRAWFLWVGLAFVGACVAVVVLSSEIARTTFTDRFATLSSLESEKSYMVRQYLNQKSWALFQESPLFGVGLGQYQEAHANIETPPWYKGRESEFDKRSSHNSYLSLLAETGVAGAVPFVVFLLVLLGFGGVAAIRLTRRGYIWALGIFVGFVSMAIHMWAISSLTNTATWFVYGLVASLVVVARRKQPRVAVSFPPRRQTVVGVR